MRAFIGLVKGHLKLKPIGFSHVFPMNSGAFPANQCSQQSSDGVGWPPQRLSTSPSSGGHWSIGFTPSVPWRPFSGKMMGRLLMRMGTSSMVGVS